MKSNILLLLIVIFQTLSSCAQNKIVQGTTTVNNQKFKIMKSKFLLKDSKTISVFPEKNKYKGPLPSRKDGSDIPFRKSDIHVDIAKVNNIINDVLKAKRQRLHENQEKIAISFIFETTGILTDINYTLSDGTIITTNELEHIDSLLRQQIKASFTGSQYKNYIAVDYLVPLIKF
ncbi:hypothetical protein ACFQZX_15340 [Mucilaginibacter litoreus]|uniref:Uncharacterized protein n=1 Tax=Mucilaginibacter litoreus TaxID=1048221 RepID=A0ABW3AVU3_9SPHI